MEEETIQMTYKELDRCNIIKAVIEKQMMQKDAARILNISVRQIRNLQNNYLTGGPKGLISKKRGKSSNHAYNKKFKHEVLQKIQKILNRCGDECGPTLIREKLEEFYKMKIATETIRKWMIETKLWVPESHKKKKVHQRRERRACFGELIQIDASDHHWFGREFPRAALTAFVDDATGALTSLYMCKEECREGYSKALKLHIDVYGKPRSMYCDKHASLKVNHLNAEAKKQITQFQRALAELDIEQIFAHSPQAKGRIERAFSTLQDRLPAEFKQRGITTVEQANRFLDEYRQKYNEKFAKAPASEKNLHRPLREGENLKYILGIVEERKLSKDLTFQYHNTYYQLNNADKLHYLKGKYIKIYVPDKGKPIVMYEGKKLLYRPYEEEQKGPYYEANYNSETDHREPPPPTHPWKCFQYQGKIYQWTIYK